MEDLSIEAQMTFKHVKFEDSPTMRALEKVAKEKGLVKPESLRKQASVPKRPDLSPSDDLMENILKLCNGLRANGFTKEASEIEENYLNYKQAQTLYETSKEKGEDLVDAAHPKGSHKLENVEGDEAVIETILDQHLKHLEMIDKKPTGKLADASQVIKAVKKALAQDATPTLAEITATANSAYSKIYSVVNEANPELTFSANSFATEFSEAITTPTVYNLGKAKEVLERLYTRLNPSITSGAAFGLSGVSDYTWNRLQTRFREARSLLEQAISQRRVYDSAELEGGAGAVAKPSPTIQLKEFTMTEGPLGPLYRRVGSLKQKLQSYKLIGSVSRNQNAVNWIGDELKELQNLTDRIDKVPENMEGEMAKQFEPEIVGFEKDVADFASQWTQSR